MNKILQTVLSVFSLIIISTNLQSQSLEKLNNFSGIKSEGAFQLSLPKAGWIAGMKG